MKKLIVAAFAVAFAAAAQAATVTWTCTNVYAGNNTDKASGIAYLFTSDIAQSTILALEGKGMEAVTTFMTGNSIAHWNGSAGLYSMTTKTDPASLNLTAGNTYTVYAVCFDTAAITADSKFYVTSSATKLIADSTTNTAFALGSQQTASQDAANWHVVPEPTSGLMMLLGMGVLALRRRRA